MATKTPWLTSAAAKASGRIDKGSASEPDESELTSLLIQRAKSRVAERDVESVSDCLEALKYAENPSEKADIKLMISLALLRKGNKEGGLWWALGAVEEDQSDAEAQHVLRLSLSFSEFHALAIAAFRRAMRSNPNAGRRTLHWGGPSVKRGCLKKPSRYSLGMFVPTETILRDSMN